MSDNNISAGVVWIIITGTLVIIVGAIKLGTYFMKKSGYSNLGKNTVVRCSRGHLFTTVWVPSASFKAVRLGTKRYQRCPVCKHWRIVSPVKDSELSEEVRQEALKYHDSKLP